MSLFVITFVQGLSTSLFEKPIGRQLEDREQEYCHESGLLGSLELMERHKQVTNVTDLIFISN